ncbi:MAG: LacI family DNA-binding transcriptional regulator [Coriobacteriaceae bacterium]|nr:LacI family DNA-binding transcriptional regulator [Coriobacteriaceae bacterium]
MVVTARDVARKAKVSAATVSLVFRNKPGVSSKTRQNVMQAAQELGYVYSSAPNPNNKTSTLQFIIYKGGQRVIGDTPFFEGLANGIVKEAYELGYHHMVTSYFYANQDSAEQLHALKNTRSAGIILLATEMRAGDIGQFERLGVPIVLLDSWFPTKSLDAIVIDNQLASWKATEYLVNRGHRKIGYLEGNSGIRNFLERRGGYTQAIQTLVDRSLNPKALAVRIGTDEKTACDDMTTWLAARGDRGRDFLPTAFVADNDWVAAGAMKALQAAGWRVPEDVSLIGFDNLPICLRTNPKLTTMAVPKERMGTIATKRLVELIENDYHEVIRIAIQPEIVQRDSVITI